MGIFFVAGIFERSALAAGAGAVAFAPAEGGFHGADAAPLGGRAGCAEADGGRTGAAVSVGAAVSIGAAVSAGGVGAASRAGAASTCDLGGGGAATGAAGIVAGVVAGVS